MSVIYFYNELINGGKYSYLFDIDNFKIDVLIGCSRKNLGSYSLDDLPSEYYGEIVYNLDYIISSLLPIGEQSKQYVRWFNFKMKVDNYLKMNGV